MSNIFKQFRTRIRNGIAEPHHFNPCYVEGGGSLKCKIDILYASQLRHFQCKMKCMGSPLDTGLPVVVPYIVEAIRAQKSEILRNEGQRYEPYIYYSFWFDEKLEQVRQK